jgi:hypothetical protein
MELLVCFELNNVCFDVTNLANYRSWEIRARDKLRLGLDLELLGGAGGGSARISSQPNPAKTLLGSARLRFVSLELLAIEVVRRFGHV